MPVISNFRRPPENTLSRSQHKSSPRRSKSSKPETWATAVAGIQEIYHVASSLPLGAPTNDEETLKPAVDGTLNVLEARRASGTVRKVIITGSYGAIWNRSPKQPGKLTADVWADPNAGGA